eukprot:2107408-Pyramimonas_sp.AAC.1
MHQKPNMTASGRIAPLGNRSRIGLGRPESILEPDRADRNGPWDGGLLPTGEICAEDPRVHA